MNHYSFSIIKHEPNKHDWRRSKVRELLVKGYNHYEIANTLQIPRSTITKDIQHCDSKIEKTCKHTFRRDCHKNMKTV
jgi:hypothetical protein